MLQKTNQFLEKAMPFLIPGIVVLGITIFSGVSSISHWVQWIFAFISFSSCLGFKLSELKRAVSKPLPVFTCFLILQLVMPAIAYVAGIVFFPGDDLTITGLVLTFTIPTGVVTLMWASIYGGNIGLSLLIVLANTLMSPILVPFTLELLMGAKVSIDVYGLVLGLLKMIVIPSILGVIVNRTLNERSRSLSKVLAPFSKISVMTVILINSAVVSPFFQDVNPRLLFLFLIVFGLGCTGYLLGFFISVLFKWEKGYMISIMYNSGMRNTGVGAALAVTYFAPATALPIVLAIIFQQFIASIAGQLVKKYYVSDEKDIRLAKQA
ncbi:bile acid:sodium symporter family protein [Aquibacillus salsiterrae]|uniref:Bile acid:sodium symporter family protein n=1 Tax=Aquibacillus salsiterrae TaxID=2950439 RepID=A0A9X3WFI9_9BACI|nr:bile acid:sodium symporter family protein [Aquibacillus salsiterrae]MDC3416086.1 bile acid:sodium symporter family protein [Aquibacillus salsiterrae]